MSPSPVQIAHHMLANDPCSQWMGIEIVEVSNGYCRIGMTVTSDMLNGFGVCHGGVTFAFADSALAFASNSGGVKSVSIDSSINHVAAVKEGDELVATAQEENSSRKTGVYLIRITRGEELVALFKGTVYRKSENWEI